MPLELTKIDKIIQFSLLVAGEEDDFSDRELGPIHLIKYVYLADLLYAKRNNGKIYTGIDWQFYNFGPWSNTVFQRLEPALQLINANSRKFESIYDDNNDVIRWSLTDERSLDDIGKELPVTITMYLRGLVHKYGKDLPRLLDYVYKTKPMLSAAPNEYLDFSLVAEEPVSRDHKGQSLIYETLSNKKKKKLKEKLREARGKVIQNTLSSENLITPEISQKQNEILQEGLSWLDDVAGEQLTPGKKIAHFSDDVWKSTTRKGEDVS